MRFFIEAGDNREVIRECFRDKRVFDPFCPDAILHQSVKVGRMCFLEVVVAKPVKGHEKQPRSGSGGGGGGGIGG